MTSIRLAVRPNLLMAILVVSVAFVFTGSFVLQVIGALYGHDHIFGLLPLLHIDREGNLAAWLSSTTMLFCSLVAWSLRSSGEYHRDVDNRAWALVAPALFLMSMDETAQSTSEWAHSCSLSSRI